jgi:TRAP-type C4-dicarboxylate transport system permease small subunit
VTAGGDSGALPAAARQPGPLRRALDGVYLAGGVLAAGFIIGIVAIIAAQVVGRLVNTNIPGSDDLTAWFVAAATFLALAYTFRHGSHIRVTLLIEQLGGGLRRLLETAVIAVSAFFVGWLAWGLGDLAHDSWRWNDVAQGLLPVPMWIPQSGAALGAGIMVIALLDDLVVSLAGGTPSYLVADGQADRTDPAGEL